MAQRGRQDRQHTLAHACTQTHCSDCHHSPETQGTQSIHLSGGGGVGREGRYSLRWGSSAGKGWAESGVGWLFPTSSPYKQADCLGSPQESRYPFKPLPLCLLHTGRPLLATYPLLGAKSSGLGSRDLGSSSDAVHVTVPPWAAVSLSVKWGPSTSQSVSSLWLM